MMKRWHIYGLLLTLALIAVCMPGLALAADADMHLEFALEPMVVENEQSVGYSWSLVNDGPYEIKGIQLELDGMPLRAADKLAAGKSMGDSGVLPIAKEDIGRRIELRAVGYALVPDELDTSKKKNAKITQTLVRACPAVLVYPGASERAYISVPSMLPLYEQEADTVKKSSLYAFARLENMAVKAGEGNLLRVFVKNDGEAALSELELKVGKETPATLDSLEPGHNAVLEYRFTAEKTKTLTPSLKYKDAQGKTRTKSLGSFKTYILDPSLRIVLHPETLTPNPRSTLTLYIELFNEGERKISDLRLFDAAQNPVQLPAKSLKAGASMRVRTTIRAGAAAQLRYWALGKGKSQLGALCEPIEIEQRIPPQTAGMKLILSPSKTELGGVGRDMVVFYCTLVNTGSYDLYGVCVMQEGKLIGAENCLPAGESRSYTVAMQLFGASSVGFSASAADETGTLRECEAAVEISEGKDFRPSQQNVS